MASTAAPWASTELGDPGDGLLATVGDHLAREAGRVGAVDEGELGRHLAAVVVAGVFAADAVQHIINAAPVGREGCCGEVQLTLGGELHAGYAVASTIMLSTMAYAFCHHSITAWAFWACATKLAKSQGN